MDKQQLSKNLNEIDIRLEICRNTLNMLAETLDEESECVLNGVIMHLENAEDILDRALESV